MVNAYRNGWECTFSKTGKKQVFKISYSTPKTGKIEHEFNLKDYPDLIKEELKEESPAKKDENSYIPEENMNKFYEARKQSPGYKKAIKEKEKFKNLIEKTGKDTPLSEEQREKVERDYVDLLSDLTPEGTEYEDFTEDFLGILESFREKMKSKKITSEELETSLENKFGSRVKDIDLEKMRLIKEGKYEEAAKLATWLHNFEQGILTRFLAEGWTINEVSKIIDI